MFADDSEASEFMADEERTSLLARLFPLGLGGRDVLAEIAPDGWERSPLVAEFHPSLERAFAEHTRLLRNIRSLGLLKRRREGAQERTDDDEEVPTLAEFAKDWHPSPIDPAREPVALVGACLWDILSNNHDLVDANGHRSHLGSFRFTAGEIADFASRGEDGPWFDYMDFYMGSSWICDRVDLVPVYASIFRRLRRLELDWSFSFPRLHLIDMSAAARSDPSGEPDWAGYSAEEGVERGRRDAEREREVEDMRCELEEGHRQAVEAALREPPPEAVRGYREVFGRFPSGWPPTIADEADES